MPAGIQSHGVGFIAFCALADHLQQSHGPVCCSTVVGKILEFPVEGAEVVELADRAGDGGQGLIVIFQARGIIAVDALLPALEAGGEEGGDVAQAVLPGHFESVKGQKISGGGGQGGLLAQPPFFADEGGILAQHSLFRSVKGIGMVCDCQKVQSRRILCIGIGLRRGAGAVGIGGVAVKLAEEKARPGGFGFLQKGPLFFGGCFLGLLHFLVFFLFRIFFPLYGSPLVRVQLWGIRGFGGFLRRFGRRFFLPAEQILQRRDLFVGTGFLRPARHGDKGTKHGKSQDQGCCVPLKSHGKTSEIS